MKLEKPDLDNNDNPLECGFEKFTNINSDVEFIGKDAIKKIQLNGINKKLMGVKIESKKIDVSSSIEIKDLNNNIIGDIIYGIYSPHFNQVIGICMINKPFWEVSKECKIIINDNLCRGILCELPFI